MNEAEMEMIAGWIDAALAAKDDAAALAAIKAEVAALNRKFPIP
jgi:glycine hydroxymethyltransferase